MNIMQSMRPAMLVAALAMLPASAVLAQADAKVLKDLGTVIILQGHPCGQAVKADKQAEDDYIVTCESGDRYHVTIDAGTDRVMVRKQ